MNILLHFKLVLKWIKKRFLIKDKGCVHSFPPRLLHPFFKYFCWTHCNSFNEQNAKLAVKKNDNAFSRFNEETKIQWSQHCCTILRYWQTYTRLFWFIHQRNDYCFKNETKRNNDKKMPDNVDLPRTCFLNLQK